MDGDVGRRSSRFPESSSPVTERGPRPSPHDRILSPMDFAYLEPHIPAGEFQNWSPGGDFLSAVFRNSSLTDTDRVMLPKPPKDRILSPMDFAYLEPRIPAGEVQNWSPDGDLLSAALLRNSSLTDTDRVMLPKPPKDVPVVRPHTSVKCLGFRSKAEFKKASQKLLYRLPSIIRGSNGQKAYLEYMPGADRRDYEHPTSIKRKDNAGLKYPVGPPDYETVLKARKGMFYLPHCERYPCLVEWRVVGGKPRLE